MFRKLLGGERDGRNVGAFLKSMIMGHVHDVPHFCNEREDMTMNDEHDSIVRYGYVDSRRRIAWYVGSRHTAQ